MHVPTAELHTPTPGSPGSSNYLFKNSAYLILTQEEHVKGSCSSLQQLPSSFPTSSYKYYQMPPGQQLHNLPEEAIGSKIGGKLHCQPWAATLEPSVSLC